MHEYDQQFIYTHMNNVADEIAFIVQRLSELCCFAVSQLLTLGKSVISCANKAKSEESDGDNEKIDWPEDSVLKAKIIRFKAQSMSGDVERVSSSFMTGALSFYRYF